MADPTLIGKQYRKAIATYLEDVQTVMRDASVDYHRVSVEEAYDSVLARFLIARTPKGSK